MKQLIRPVISGFLWSGVFLGGSIVFLAAVVVWQVHSQGLSEAERRQLSHQMGEKYGETIIVGSVGAAVLGTATQKLPGTRRK